jgi:hypothetical protein
MCVLSFFIIGRKPRDANWFLNQADSTVRDEYQRRSDNVSVESSLTDRLQSNLAGMFSKSDERTALMGNKAFTPQSYASPDQSEAGEGGHSPIS